MGFAFLRFCRASDGRFDLIVLRSKLPPDFLGLFKQQKVGAVSLIALSEVLFSVSEAITLYATLLAPVALVLLVNSFQPLFVFTFGVVLTLFLPRVAKESLGRMQMLQKAAGIGLILAGGYLISR